jgi:carbon monoxide dehydrogenase subunit G
MAVVVSSTEIARPPQDVFAYATDFAHFADWQSGVISVRGGDDRQSSVGSRAIVTRRVGPRELTAPEEISELDPPRTWSVRAEGGPVTAIARGEIEPLADGERSRVTISLHFEGHGIGRLLVPLVIRRQAGKALPQNLQRLKEVLERGQ